MSRAYFWDITAVSALDKVVLVPPGRHEVEVITTKPAPPWFIGSRCTTRTARTIS